MGAHFGLRLVEGADEATLGALGVPLFGDQLARRRSARRRRRCRGRAPGCSATKGRASAPRSRRAARAVLRDSAAGRRASRSTSPPRPPSACTRLRGSGRAERVGRPRSPRRRSTRCRRPCARYRPQSAGMALTAADLRRRRRRRRAARRPRAPHAGADARAPPTRELGAAGVLQVRELPAHGRVQVPRRVQRAVALRRARSARAGVVAFSSGNHAQAIALAARCSACRRRS